LSLLACSAPWLSGVFSELKPGLPLIVFSRIRRRMHDNRLERLIATQKQLFVALLLQHASTGLVSLFLWLHALIVVLIGAGENRRFVSCATAEGSSMLCKWPSFKFNVKVWVPTKVLCCKLSKGKCVVLKLLVRLIYISSSVKNWKAQQCFILP